MKTKNTGLGRTLSGKVHAARQAALTTRRAEQSFCRFLETLNGGFEFGEHRALREPIG